MSDPYLTPTQVARAHPHLGTARTIQRWVRRELIDCYRTPGGHLRFSPEQIQAMLDLRPRRQHHPEVLAPNPAFSPVVRQLELVKRTRNPAA